MTTIESSYQIQGSEQSSPPCQAAKLSPISRLYVWSIIFEPLLLFMVFQATTTGVTGNISKVLQLIVLVGLLLKFLNSCLNKGLDSIQLVNVSSPIFVNFRNYFILIVFSGLIGIMSGAYNVPFQYDFDYAEFTGISKMLNSKYIRPVFEYCILLYYFGYFVILPKYLLNNKSKIEYFFSVFKKVFVISFVLGFIDLGFTTIADIPLLPRNLADAEVRFVGARFHGLAGEPRDAFVYLFLGLAILHLEAYYRGTKLNKWWIVAIIYAAVATQSASGVVGIVVFVGLYFLVALSKLSVRRIVHLLIVSLASSLLIYIVIVSSERITLYLEAASGIWDILESGSKIPYLMMVQMVDIYPIYDLTVKIRDFNFFPILIGSGLGSASAINNLIPGVVEIKIANPHAQIVRVIYESGIIGSYLFVRVFTHPVIFITKHIVLKERDELILMTLLLLGVSLGHRSSASFIYLGIVIAVFRILVSWPRLIGQNAGFDK